MTAHLLLMCAGFGAGVMNALAGGGSFLTFPALVFLGVPSIIANASSSVALFPAAFASAWGYRDDFKSIEGIRFKWLLVVSLAGGTAGALLLLLTTQRLFDQIIPWILLLATLIFVFAPRLTPSLQHIFKIQPLPFLTVHFFVGIYAGYFGGALGLITLAVWNLFGLTDIKAMNPTKILLGGSTNAAAVACFIIAGKVWWIETAAVLAGAVLGGYVGARLGRRIPHRVIRGIVVVISVVTTVIFFMR